MGKIAKAYGLSVDTAKKLAEGFTAAEAEHSASVVKAAEGEFTPEGKYEVSAEGKAIDKGTDEIIDIKGVSSIRNGEMVLDIGDGKTIDAKNVSYASNEQALVYEAVANLGDKIDADTANKLISQYKGGDAMVFVKGISEAYTYGFYGLDTSEMLNKGSFAGNLTDAQRNTAYGLGKKYRAVKDQADKAKARATKKISEKGVYYRSKNGTDTDINTYLKEHSENLNDMQKTAIEVMQKMSETMGVRFNVYETWTENGKQYYLNQDGVKTEGNPNGFYDTETGEIYIDLHAGNDYKGTMLFTIAHELTHFMRQWSPEHFTKIANIVFTHGGMKGNISNYIASKIEAAEKHGRTISYDTAMEEVVADAMETILKDGKVVEFMAEVKQKDHAAWVKLKEWFQNLSKFLKKLVGAYEGRSAYTVEGQKVADFAEDLLQQIEQIYAEGAVAAGENYQAAEAQKNTTDEGGVKFMSREDSARIKAQIVAVSDQLNQMDAVVSVTTDGFVGMKKSDIAKVVETEYAKFGKRIERQNFGIILLEFPQINKALEYLNTDGEKAALLVVPRVLKRGIIADMHTEHKGRGIDSITFAAPVEINGKRGNVGVVVQRDSGTNRFKTLRILLPNGKAFEFIKNKEADSTTGSSSKHNDLEGVPIESASKISIRNESGIVKTESAEAVDLEADTKLSDRDTTKYAGRGYGGIREVLAKKGLDELSKRYGSYFPLSASFDATMRADNTPLVMTTVKANQVKSKPKESPFKAGKQAFRAAYGVKTSVHIKQMGIDAELFSNVASESIAKAIGQANEQSTLDVIPHISDILSNSILMGVERIAHTDGKGTALYGYRLYNLYWYNDGKVKTPHCLACTVVQSLDKAEGYVFQNIENVTIDQGLPGNKTGMPSSVNGNAYTVSQLYRTVKKIDRFDGGLQYTTAERDKYLFSYTERNDGTKYSDRDSDGNQLSVEQQEFFKDSKVRDADGKLRAVYHGTDADFNTFEADFISSDNKLGFGFYFMAGKKLQYEYKHTKTVYLNITNPITDISKKLSKQVVGDFCKKLGIEFKYYSDDSDLDVYTRLCYSYVGSTKEFLKQAVNILGVDGVLSEERNVAVAFDSSQIKSVDNKNPTSNPDIRYQDRTDESVSNRYLLANALEGAAQNEIEKNKIQEYKGKIDRINAEEQKLHELNEQIKELSFAKGPRDTKKIRELQFEANQTANRISTYDKQLLRLEASKPLQDVLTREKKKAYKRAEQKGKEALAAYREKATKTQREMLERYQESRKKAVESRERTAMRHKIQSVVGELNQLLLSNDKKRHVPDSLKKAVADALSLVNMDTVGAEERAAKYAALIEKETDPDKIDAYTVTMENILRQGEKMGQRLKELRDAYEEIQNSDDPDIANAYDPVIAGSLQELSQSIGNTSLKNMTIEQLQDVYDMYRMVLTRVRDANKSLIDSIKETIANRASRVVGEVKRVGGEHKYRVAVLDAIKKFSWNNLKPVYAMERIGSNTLTEAYNNVRAGEDTWAKDVTDARRYYLDKSKKYGYDAWDFNKKYKFKSTSETEFELTLEQILSLYAYSKREQAHDHLRLGGFVFDSNIETYKEKGSKLLKYKVNTADAHQISPEILANITGTLTKEQIAFVDEMQEYLSTVMGAKGNEVTMKMYGVKLFKEKLYFPLKSARQFMFEQNEVSGEVRIKNSGFTNKVVAKANNPVILNDFMDVWADHVNDMSMYHAFVLPLEDFNRIFNYNSPKQEGKPPVSVKGTVQNAYSPAAVDYVKQLITDLNGGAMADPRETTAKSLLAKFKKAKVFSSLSVVIQQPSSIGRAFALVNPKYFHPTKDGKNHNELWAELKQYAPVAVIKEMGYFDTNMGKSTQDFIKAKEYSGIKEKAKALFTDSGYRDEALSKLPALADEVTWCAIWNAVKRETKDIHKDLKPGSEEFLKAAGKRFTEVVTKTQVYDSVLARSANMRSKSGLMSMITSFMAEPTTAINMLEDAILKGKRGYKGYAAKAFAGVMVSVFLNNALVSLVYGMRDDDEDETFLEKYMQAFTSGLIDDINPITYYPFLKDMWSLLQGYDVERADMSLISDFSDAAKGLVMAYASEDGDIADAWWSFAGSVANIGGIPMENIRRDVNGAINFVNTIIEDVNGRETTWGSMGDAVGSAVKGSIPVWGWLPGDKKSDNLYDAIASGDKAYADRLKGSYKDEDAYHSAVRKALRENDPRIREAAQAQINGDPSERERIAKMIIADGFTQDDVVMAIKAEINDMKPDEPKGEPKEKGVYSAEDFALEIANGDQASAYAAKEDIIATAQKNGKTEEEAKKSFASSATSELKKLFLSGKISESKAINALTTYCDKSEENAQETVSNWSFEAEYGFSYSNKAEAYKSGEISSYELKEILMDEGGMTSDEADNQIAAYDWEAQGYDATAAAVRDYNEYCASVNVPKDVYLHIRSFANNTENDKDANGKSISYSAMKKIMAEINVQHGLSSAQKTAIARSLGWAEKNIQKYKPW